MMNKAGVNNEGNDGGSPWFHVAGVLHVGNVVTEKCCPFFWVFVSFK